MLSFLRHLHGLTGVLVIVTVLGCGSEDANDTHDAGRSVLWPNEPAGSRVLTDWPFVTATGGGWEAPFGFAGALLSDSSAPVSPPSVVRHYRDSTSTNGGDFIYEFPSGVDELYLGFTVKLSNPHYGWFNGQYQKIVLIGQATQHMYMQANDISGTADFQLIDEQGSAYRNEHITSAGGPFPCNIVSCRYALGVWHKIEIYYKASTGTNTQDGTLKVWIDGTLTASYSNVNLTAQLDDVWIANIWDAINTQLPQQEWVEYDHVRISLPPRR